MPLNAEPSAPAGPPLDPAVAPSTPLDTTADVPEEAQREDLTAGRDRAPSDGGSMRPLVVFLVAAAVALVGSIVFALVHVGNERERAQLADARADVVQAVDEGRAAQDGLAQQIAAAEEALASSDGKVVDDAVRTDLAGHIAAAKELGAMQPPAVPEPGTAALDTTEDIDALEAEATEWAITMRTTATTLVTATEDVQASNQQWQQDRKDAQAAAAAKAERAKKAAAQLKTARATLTSVTEQLKISVRDSRVHPELDRRRWRTRRRPQDPHDPSCRGRGGARGRDEDEQPALRETLGQRREAARAAIEAAAWDARATVADGANGRLDLDKLCKVGVGPEGQDQYLRCDAAEAWKKLGPVRGEVRQAAARGVRVPALRLAAPGARRVRQRAGRGAGHLEPRLGARGRTCRSTTASASVSPSTHGSRPTGPRSAGTTRSGRERAVAARSRGTSSTRTDAEASSLIKRLRAGWIMGLCSAPHYDAGRCHSCTLLEIDYPTQVLDKERHVAALLAPVSADRSTDSSTDSPDRLVRQTRPQVCPQAPS